MNYRRALRASTDTGLTIFLIMMVGVILWTTDEVLNWNILPDWIDKYAQLLVIVLSILAGFAVVISLMCSFAVLAESAAEKAGISSPAPSRRARAIIAVGILSAFVLMFGLHKIDQYRAGKGRQAEEQKKLAKYVETQKALEGRIPEIVALFSSDISRHMVAGGSSEGDEMLARLLNAIHASTPFDPQVAVMVNAQTPYRYCVITALPEPLRAADASAMFLKRQFLTDLPAKWEHDAIEAIFRGQQPSIQRESHGVFLDTRKPSAWGIVTREAKVVGIVMVRATAQPSD